MPPEAPTELSELVPATINSVVLIWKDPAGELTGC